MAILIVHIVKWYNEVGEYLAEFDFNPVIKNFKQILSSLFK